MGGASLAAREAATGQRALRSGALCAEPATIITRVKDTEQLFKLRTDHDERRQALNVRSRRPLGLWLRLAVWPSERGD